MQADIIFDNYLYLIPWGVSESPLSPSFCCSVISLHVPSLIRFVILFVISPVWFETEFCFVFVFLIERSNSIQLVQE